MRRVAGEGGVVVDVGVVFGADVGGRLLGEAVGASVGAVADGDIGLVVAGPSNGEEGSEVGLLYHGQQG